MNSDWQIAGSLPAQPCAWPYHRDSAVRRETEVDAAYPGHGSFGALLRRRRLAAGLTQEDLAGRSGLSVRAISNLERGITASPYSSSVRLLADALNLPEQARQELVDAASPAAEATLPRAAGTVRPMLQPVTVPRQLPAAVGGGFVGRDALLRVMDGLIDGTVRTGTVVISAIGGTAGVGKTALALHWAHQVADRFPDGQLYVDLRGFGPSSVAADPTAVIHGFLDALGVPGERIPSSLEGSAALYRSMLTGRRVLVVLDNAHDEQQARPLLPGSPGCVALVTSRRQLASLIAIEGAYPVTVEVLAPAEARELLSRRLGRERVTAESKAVTDLAELCARLPLALVIAAARAAIRPSLPLAELTAELRAAAGRLDALDAGDAASNVRAVYSWSYRQLTKAAAAMFRFLGVHPGPDITEPVAASLAATTPAAARQMLAELARAHLITEHRLGRFALHDLLRAYATEQASATDDPAELHAARHRALDHYLHTAHRAAMLLSPAKQQIRLEPPHPGTSSEAIGDEQQALAWFDAEYQVLLATAARAAEEGWHTHAWQIPCVAEHFFFRRGHWLGLAEVLRAAVDAVERVDDLVGQAYARRSLGRASARLGSYAEATAHLIRALDLFRLLGDRTAEAHIHLDLGGSLELQGRYREALTHAEQARDLFRSAGDSMGQAGAQNNIGWYQIRLGNYEPAIAECQRALTGFRRSGFRRGEGSALDSLGYAHHQLGDYVQAIAHGQEALRIFRTLGDRYDEAEILTHLGDALQASGDHQAACNAWHQALAILDDLQHPDAAQVRAKLQ